MSGTKVTAVQNNIVAFWQCKIANGDPSWIEDIYRDNKKPFISWAEKNCDFGKETLRDIYQSTVIIFYENIFYKKIEKLNSTPCTYLFGIGRNLILKKYRQNKKVEDHKFRLQEHWNFIQLQENDMENTYKLVKAVLETTNEPCKSIIELYYLKGMSIDGIAKQQGYKNANVVKTQKSRCMNAFKEAVKNIEFHEC